MSIWGCDKGDEGVALLANGLRRGCLPSLTVLRLVNAQIGPQGATALASALTKRAVPSLEVFSASAIRRGATASRPDARGW